MTDRIICIESACSLSTRNEQLVLSFASGGEQTVPFEDLSMVLIDNREVDFTVPVIDGLTRYGAGAVVCDVSHTPSTVVMPLHATTRQTKRYNLQMAQGDEDRRSIWNDIVVAKILNQAAVLDFLSLEGGEKIREMVEGKEVSLREGAAADRYWKSLFGKRFRRDRFGDGPNPLLNYGYAVLRAATVKALLCAGLHPCFGLHHKNQYDDFVLADDLMEPFRVFVDLEVYKMWGEGIRETDKDARNRLVGVLLSNVRSGDRTVQLRHALSQAAVSLVSRMDDGGKLALPTL